MTDESSETSTGVLTPLSSVRASKGDELDSCVFALSGSIARTPPKQVLRSFAGVLYVCIRYPLIA